MTQSTLRSMQQSYEDIYMKPTSLFRIYDCAISALASSLDPSDTYLSLLALKLIGDAVKSENT